MNSNFRYQVNNNNLRYIDWSNRKGNSPAILDLSDYIKIIKSESFFARKFDYPVSQHLVEKLKYNRKL